VAAAAIYVEVNGWSGPANLRTQG